jgi:hypothetical protein
MQCSQQLEQHGSSRRIVGMKPEGDASHGHIPACASTAAAAAGCCCRLCKSITPRSMVESHGAVSAWPTRIIVKHSFSIEKLKVRVPAQTADSVAAVLLLHET